MPNLILRKTVGFQVAVLVCVLSHSATAEVTIDQSQPSINSVMAGFSQGVLAQSFQQSTTNIADAGIYIADSDSHDDTGSVRFSV